MRLGLDRLIYKVRLLDEQPEAGPFESKLRGLFADGRIDDGTFRALLRAHREEERRETANVER